MTELDGLFKVHEATDAAIVASVTIPKRNIALARDTNQLLIRKEDNTLLRVVTGDRLERSNPTATGTLTTDALRLSPTAGVTPTAVGTAYWEASEHTATLVLENGSRLQIGRENVQWCKNSTGVTIPNGAVVYVSGATGDTPQISLASATTDPALGDAIGMATQSIPANGEGMIATNISFVRGLDTSATAPGTRLWLSTTAGAWSSAPPARPNCRVQVGFVLRQHALEGIVLLWIVRYPPIAELPDVDTTGVSAGQSLVYGVDGVWRPGATLTLGDLSTTAYRGDRGKIAYDHSLVSGNPHGTTAAQVGAAAVSHAHAASDITSGTFSSARIPSLDAAIITTGTFNAARIPALPTSRITGLDAALVGKSDVGHTHAYLLSNNPTFTGVLTGPTATLTEFGKLQALVGDSNYAAIYGTGVTPSGSNYVLRLADDGGSSALNAAVFVDIAVGGAAKATVKATELALASGMALKMAATTVIDSSRNANFTSITATTCSGIGTRPVVARPAGNLEPQDPAAFLGTIGAAPSSHTHPYLPIANPTFTGTLTGPRATLTEFGTLRDRVGNPAFGALYAAGVTPAATNYVLAMTDAGTETYLGASNKVVLVVGGTSKLTVDADEANLASGVALKMAATTVIDASRNASFTGLTATGSPVFGATSGGSRGITIDSPSGTVSGVNLNDGGICRASLQLYAGSAWRVVARDTGGVEIDTPFYVDLVAGGKLVLGGTARTTNFKGAIEIGTVTVIDASRNGSLKSLTVNENIFLPNSIVWKSGATNYFSMYATSIEFGLRDLNDAGSVIAYPLIVKRGVGGEVQIGYSGGLRPVRIGGALKNDNLAGSGTRPLVALSNGTIDDQDAATFRETIGAAPSSHTHPYLPINNPAFTGRLSGNDVKIGGGSTSGWLQLVANNTGSGTFNVDFLGGASSNRRMTFQWSDTLDNLNIMTSNDDGSARLDRVLIPRSSALPIAVAGGFNVSSGNLSVGGVAVVDANRNITGTNVSAGNLRVGGVAVVDADRNITGATLKGGNLTGTGNRPLVAGADGTIDDQDAATFRGTIGALAADNPDFTGALKQGGTTRITAGGDGRFTSLRASGLAASNTYIPRLDANGELVASPVKVTPGIGVVFEQAATLQTGGGAWGGSAYTAWSPSAVIPISDDTAGNAMSSLGTGYLWNSKRLNALTITDGAAASPYRGRVRADRWVATSLVSITETTSATSWFAAGTGDGSPTIPANYLKAGRRVRVEGRIFCPSCVADTAPEIVLKVGATTLWTRSKAFTIAAGNEIFIDVRANIFIDDENRLIVVGDVEFSSPATGVYNFHQGGQIDPYNGATSSTIDVTVKPSSVSEKWVRSFAFIEI